MAPSRRKGGSKAAAKAAARREWKVGDLVLAKVKGHPAWPATVSEPKAWGYKSDDWKKVLVYFFGTKQIAFCNPADVEEFTEEKKTALLGKRSGRSADFVRAVQEISDSFEKLKELSIVNELESGDAPLDNATEGSADVNDSVKSSDHSGKRVSKLPNGKVEPISSAEDDVEAIKISNLLEAGKCKELSDEIHVSDKPVARIGSKRTRTSQSQGKGSGRSRSSARSESSRVLNGTGTTAFADHVGTNGSLDVSLRRNTIREQTFDRFSQEESTVGKSNGILDGAVSEAAMEDRDSLTKSEAKVTDCDLKHNMSQSPTLCCKGDIPLSQRLEFNNVAVVLRKKRNSGRKRASSDGGRPFPLADLEVKNSAHCSRPSNKDVAEQYSKDEGDEHLPLVKRARVRMGKSSEELLDVSVEERSLEGVFSDMTTQVDRSPKCVNEDHDERPTSLEPVVFSDTTTQVDGSLKCVNEDHDEKPTFSLEPVVSPSPSDSSAQLSEGNPMVWKARKTPSFSSSYDGEAALPPSKRLNRALEAMSANAAEEGQHSVHTPPCAEEVYGACVDGSHKSNSQTNVEERDNHSEEQTCPSRCNCVSQDDCLTACASSNPPVSEGAINTVIPAIMEVDTDDNKDGSKDDISEVMPGYLCDKDYSGSPNVTKPSNFATSVGSPKMLNTNTLNDVTNGQDPHVIDHLSVQDEKKIENLEVHNLCDMDHDGDDDVSVAACQSDTFSIRCEDNIERPINDIVGKNNSLENNLTVASHEDDIFSSKNNGGNESPKSQEISKSPVVDCISIGAIENQVPIEDAKLQNACLEEIVTNATHVTRDETPSSSVLDVTASPQKLCQVLVSAEELHTQAVASSSPASVNNCKRISPISAFSSKSDNCKLGQSGGQMISDSKLHIEKHHVDIENKKNVGLPCVSTSERSNSSEVKAAFVSLEVSLESLTRTKDSIGRATRIAMDCAKLGSATEVIEILAHTLERESNLYRRIDLFFLVDSIAQCSRGIKGSIGGAFISAIQSTLPRLISAAAPAGYTARENRRQCLKVLRLWVERRILTESIVKPHIRDLDSYNCSSGAYSRRMSRTERSFDDPIREMEGMLVDEYGSNASFQLPGFSMPRMVKIEDDDGSDSDGERFEAVTPERERTISPKEVPSSLPTPQEKHRHILEDVDGELEMEDVAPSCEAETTGATSNGTLVHSAQPGDQSFSSFAPPLPCDVPPVVPPPPSSPPPPPPPLPPPQAHPPPPPPPPPPPLHQHQHPPAPTPLVGMDSRPRHSMQEGIPLQLPPPRMTSQMQMNDSSNSCSYNSYPVAHPSARPSNDHRQVDGNYNHNNAYHVRPPQPTPSNQFSYFQGEHRPPRPPPRDVPPPYCDRDGAPPYSDRDGPPYCDRPRYQHSMESGGHYYSEHDRSRSRTQEHSDRWRHSRPYPDKSRGYAGRPQYADHPPCEPPPRVQNHGWNYRPRPMHHRNHGPSRHFSEGPVPVPVRDPSYWPPR